MRDNMPQQLLDLSARCSVIDAIRGHHCFEYNPLTDIHLDRQIVAHLYERTSDLLDLVDEYLDAKRSNDLDRSNRALMTILNDSMLKLLSSYWLDPGAGKELETRVKSRANGITIEIDCLCNGDTRG